MTKITIEVHNEEDKRLLIDLIHRMNLNYEAVEKENDNLISIIDRGGMEKVLKIRWPGSERSGRIENYHSGISIYLYDTY